LGILKFTLARAIAKVPKRNFNEIIALINDGILFKKC
jgi:hypothetical protein